MSEETQNAPAPATLDDEALDRVTGGRFLQDLDIAGRIFSNDAAAEKVDAVVTAVQNMGSRLYHGITTGSLLDFDSSDSDKS